VFSEYTPPEHTPPFESTPFEFPPLPTSSVIMAFPWRSVFTFNRYSAIAARAVRRALKDDKRLKAEKRNESNVRVSSWKNGVQGEQVQLGSDVEKGH
jgi:F-type H+-transporting ATPase subunit epsilon